MDKTRRDLIELMGQIEVNGPERKKYPNMFKAIESIKDSWNGHTRFQYDEYVRRLGNKKDQLKAGKAK